MKQTPLLEMKDLHVTVEGQEILRGVNLAVQAGEVHALMGPNGSGKSTLASAIMGHPKYKVTRGQILYRGEEITALTPDQRAHRGLFLAFQYPTAIPGVTLVNFLRTALKVTRGQEIPVVKFRRLLREKMSLLKMDDSFTRRYINDGFSGGEKKRAEVLQLAILQPQMAVLDETDSGLDIDALRIVADGVNALIGPELGVLLITHYQRILQYIKPHYVHVIVGGRIVQSGGPELAQELEASGYEGIIQQLNAGKEAPV